MRGNRTVFDQVRKHVSVTAIVDAEGKRGYPDLADSANRVSRGLLQGDDDLDEARVAFLAPPGFDYVATLLGIWAAGGVAVPLCLSHPRAELEYVLTDCGARFLIAHPSTRERVQGLSDIHEDCRLVTTADLLSQQAPERPAPALDLSRRALILYTSGTTGRPKGVVTSHANISAQIRALVEAWQWTPQDHILHVLPLHHTHGIVNVLLCALWVGAVCEFLPAFESGTVWRRFSEGGLTLFMAVPTIYARLARHWEQKPVRDRETLSLSTRAFRLMVSGSAALPQTLFERWREISGHTLLERYGMTEIGMALSNPLHGERRPGFVGRPLPSVEVKLLDEAEDVVTEDGKPGEILVKGPSVFREYWGRLEETRESFRDGWFRTGDIAVTEGGDFRILGRNSVDIIKTGGYKVSALEIEAAVGMHPDIRECAVVGAEDPEWGERVCLAAVLEDTGSLTLESLRAWAKERLAIYKVPSRLELVETLPRNALGKVTKPDIKKLFASRGASC